jgi:ABC-type transport system involved in multi-copper enzyme maturation permease subunit
MRQPVVTIARYTFLEAIKNRLFILVLLGLAGVFVFGQFTGELAVTETREVQAAMAGFAVIFVVSLFVITSVIREFNDKTVDMILSLPLPRHVYYLGKLSGFFLFAIVVAVLAGVSLLLYSGFAQVAIWTFSLLCELLIMIALCLLFLFTLGNIVTACTAAVAFYVLARSIATLQLIGKSPVLETAAFSQKFINSVLDLIALVLPALDKFTRTEWLEYGNGDITQLGFICAQTVVYVLLLSAAALFDLYRKNF